MLPCVDKNGLVRPHHCLIANDTLTIEYCEDYEGRCERREKRFHLKRFAIEMSTLKIHARYHCNLHKKICGRNAYDDSNYQKIMKADEGEAYAVRSLKFGVFSCY